jgi:hypothetical protein
MRAAPVADEADRIAGQLVLDNPLFTAKLTRFAAQRSVPQ